MNKREASVRPESELVEAFQMWLEHRKARLHHAFSDEVALVRAISFVREAFMAGWSARTLTQTLNPTIKILERCFEAEINRRLPCQMRESAALSLAIKTGLVEPMEVRSGACIIRGHKLTVAGHLSYCESCASQDEKGTG